MNTEYLVIAFSLIALGMIATGFGIRIRLGKSRKWYLVPNYYVLLPKGGYYAMPIGGLMIIAIGLGLLMPSPTTARLFIFGIAFPLMVCVYLVVVYQPKWFKPRWIRWLEEYHSDILEILIREGRKTPDWAKRVSTQEGLEQWVAEVRRKHKL